LIRAAILTVSDSVAAGTRPDVSGPETSRVCRHQGWNVVHSRTVRDDCDEIANQLIEWADSGEIDLILTTGGTGIAARDVTPEATASVLERELPGFAEAMRTDGRTKTKFSILSRATAGVRGATLIVNLPGSPKGAVESLESVAGVIAHAVDLLKGNTAHPEQT
jgi:molybdenum cofactor synthesis domain-containing protein